MVDTVRMQKIVAAFLLLFLSNSSVTVQASVSIGAGETSEKSATSQVKDSVEVAEAADSSEKNSWKLSEEWIQKTKNPVSWFKWGADLRAREEYVANAQQNSSLPEPENHHQRYRFRAWADIKPVDYFSFHTRATYVLRNFIDPSQSRGIESGETIFDNFYLKLFAREDSSYELRLGRQELTDMGIPWLIMDGTSRDGSRTSFFDGGRFTYRFPDDETTMDAIYLYQSARSDAWLPPIDMQQSRKYLSEEDIQGGMILLKQIVKKYNLESLFLL